MNGVCTPTMYMYILYLNKVAVRTDSFASHFIFGPFFFSSKNLPPLRGQSAINKMLLALAHQLQDESDNDQPLPFHYHLKKHFRIRHIHRITRQALMDPFLSPFLKLYHSQCTQSMITCTGFDYESFNSLLLLFTLYFEQFSPYSDKGGIIRIRREKGHKRMISPMICLGLVLAWTRSRGNVFSLQLDFGLSHSSLTLWLRFGKRIVVNVLRQHPLARVKMPSQEEVLAFQQATMASTLLFQRFGALAMASTSSSNLLRMTRSSPSSTMA
jgi:hypothetical protein